MAGYEPLLHITQPTPLPMLPLKLHVPLAGEIQEHNGGNPHKIDKGQAVAIACRNWLKNKIPTPKPRGWLMNRPSYDDGHDVKQVDMQHVIEHRHAPENEKDSSQPTFGSLRQTMPARLTPGRASLTESPETAGLKRVEERDHCEGKSRLYTPRAHRRRQTFSPIAVQVDPAQGEEGKRKRNPNPENQLCPVWSL